MFSKHPIHGQLASIRRKDLAPADTISIEVLDAEGSEVRAMTLPQAWEHIKHSKTPSHLAPTQSRLYRIQPLKVVTDQKSLIQKIPLGKKAFKRSGRSKDLPLTTIEQRGRLQLILSKAYMFLLRGCRVEFRLAQKTHNSCKLKTVDWALENAPHLRPDTILSAMPKGSRMLVQPCTAPESSKSEKGRSQLIWAVEHPPSLHRVGAPTPKALYEMGQWEDEYKPLVKSGRRKDASLEVDRPIRGQRTDLDMTDVDFDLEKLCEVQGK